MQAGVLMSLYPLGISRRRDIAGVPNQAAGSVNVRWSLSGELACAFIDAPHEAIPPMLHATVLDAIHRRICVLPVRFGLALHDEAEIHALLQDRHPELLDRLGCLDCACEMGVQIAPEDRRGKAEAGMRKGDSEPFSTDKAAGSPVPPPPSPLRLSPQSPLAYLEQRRSFYRLADDDAEQNHLMVRQIVEGLHGCYRQWRKLSPTLLHPIRLAFLIERDCATAFRNCVKNARGAFHEARCVVLGPWPPYSFAEINSESLHANLAGLGFTSS